MLLKFTPLEFETRLASLVQAIDEIVKIYSAGDLKRLSFAAPKLPASLRIKFPIMSAAAGVLALKEARISAAAARRRGKILKIFRTAWIKF